MSKSQILNVDILNKCCKIQRQGLPALSFLEYAKVETHASTYKNNLEEMVEKKTISYA